MKNKQNKSVEEWEENLIKLLREFEGYCAVFRIGAAWADEEPAYVFEKRFKKLLSQQRTQLLEEVLEKIGEDDTWKNWITATKKYGGTREEFDKMKDYFEGRNQLRQELRDKIREL